MRSEAGMITLNTGAGSKPSMETHRDQEVAASLKTVAPLSITFHKYNSVYRTQYWFLCLLVVFFAAIPWIHWTLRFSLRTLLITTTLIAVVLGLIVYAVR
jgi:hypothetical protein